MMKSSVKEFVNNPERRLSKSASAAQVVECYSCQQTNSPDRRFCTKCGGSLWRNCLQCGTECAGNEVFCGHCGGNYQEILSKRLADIEQATLRAKELRDSGDFAQAILLLRSLPDAESNEIRQKLSVAQQLATDLATERNQLTKEAEEATQQAEDWIALHRYKEVLVRLQAIPQAFRTERIRKLLEAADTAYREIKSLRNSIAADVEARRLLQLAPRIDRYLTLQPTDEKVRILAARVRDLVGAKVRWAVAAADYVQAGQLLEHFPLSSLDDATEQLQSEVRELNRLHGELRCAPQVDGALVAIAQRLLLLAPHDPKAPKLVAQVTKRLQQSPSNQRFPIVPWAPAPEKSQVGAPVDWIAGFQRLRGANAAIDDNLRKHPGAFFIAAGLALQGLGLAPLSINLMPAANSTGLLGKLSRFRKTPVVKTVWGIDVGRSAVKAVKITLAENPSESPTIRDCSMIPHRMSLGAPAAETQRSAIILESLQKWREQHQPTDDELICINGPATKMLGRFFKIPSVKSNKINELVTHEVSQQIPYALEDLNWGYQILNAPNGTEEVSWELRSVVLAAMRASDTRDQLQPFDELGIAVHMVQAESLALHNFLVYDHFQFCAKSAPDSQEPGDRIALLDVGSDASNLVISSRDHVWFRTLRYGGNDMNQAISREFKLTFAQAEELKHHLDKARKLGPLLELMDHTLAKLLSEVQRTLELYAKEQSGTHIHQVWLCGGGANQFGLLRQFRSGSVRSH